MRPPDRPGSADEPNPYAAPTADLGDPRKPGGSKPLSPAYRPAVWVALAQQIFVLLVAALVLDRGRTLRVVAVCALLSWAVNAMLIYRHQESPTQGDLAFIKYGPWLVLALAAILVALTSLS